MQEHPTPGLRRVGRKPIEKAAAIVAEGRVKPLAGEVVYLVAGDSDNYRVSAGPDGIFCPCPATTPLCSHVLAVAQLRATDQLVQIGTQRVHSLEVSGDADLGWHEEPVFGEAS